MEMEISIREDFGGIGMWGHRDDLVEHLDRVQRELDRGLAHFNQVKRTTTEDDIQRRKELYGNLKDVLLEEDKATTETLTRKPTRMIFFNQLTDPCGCVQNPTRPSTVLCHFCAHNPIFGTAGATSGPIPQRFDIVFAISLIRNAIGRIFQPWKVRAVRGPV